MNPDKMKYQIVSIPHGGLGTLGLTQTEFASRMSPSHTVGSELGRNSTLFQLLLGLHPTRWARNRGKRNWWNWWMECLHPTRWARNSKRTNKEQAPQEVSIPHGGLGTESECLSENHQPESPSHTVGSEPIFPFLFLSDSICSLHPTRWARNDYIDFVDLEEYYVSIPHGGLGT